MQENWFQNVVFKIWRILYGPHAFNPIEIWLSLNCVYNSLTAMHLCSMREDFNIKCEDTLQSKAYGSLALIHIKTCPNLVQTDHIFVPILPCANFQELWIHVPGSGVHKKAGHRVPIFLKRGTPHSSRLKQYILDIQERSWDHKILESINDNPFKHANG